MAKTCLKRNDEGFYDLLKKVRAGTFMSSDYANPYGSPIVTSRYRTKGIEYIVRDDIDYGVCLSIEWGE